MLSSLKIKNLALIESTDWQVGEGLVCVSGETGAGKSLVIKSLKLSLGARPEKEDIRSGCESASVEAVFDISEQPQIARKLAEFGIEPLDESDAEKHVNILVKRIINKSGSNRQFINNTPVTLTALREITRGLVDMHDPHEQNSLSFSERQLEMLDAFVQSPDLFASYRQQFQKWQSAKSKINDFLKASSTSEAEVDILRFQLEEIDSANLGNLNEEKLHERYKQSQNLKQIKEVSARLMRRISDDGGGGIAEQVTDIFKDAKALEQLDSQAEKIFSLAEKMSEKFDELERSCQNYCFEVEGMDEGGEEIEEQINRIESLKRKYGGQVDDVLAYAEKIRKTIENWENKEQTLESLKKAEADELQALQKIGGELSEIRKSGAKKFCQEINESLADLGLDKSEFNIKISPAEVPTESGCDVVEFYFAPNPGEPEQPISAIASSGEMSRILLAVKSSIAMQERIPLLVFDEIDANVGGVVAHSVGEKMAKLAKNHQVISITHLPQVAAKADCHYVAVKKFENNRTKSIIYKVTGDEKVAEITRMLGGGYDEARQLAEKLLAD